MARGLDRARPVRGGEDAKSDRPQLQREDTLAFRGRGCRRLPREVDIGAEPQEMTVMDQERPDEGSITGTDQQARRGSVGHLRGRWPIHLCVSLSGVQPHCAFPPVCGPATSAFSPFFQPTAPATLSLLPLVLCPRPGNCGSSPCQSHGQRSGKHSRLSNQTGPRGPSRALPIPHHLIVACEILPFKSISYTLL